jgi:hypothetical protein
MDSIRFTGKLESSVEVDKQEAEIILPLDYDPTLNSQYLEYNTSHTRKFKANSGHLTIEEKEMIIEFIISENRYEVVKNRFIKIQLLTDKAKLVKDLEYMNALEIDYSYAHSNPGHSNL